MHGLGEGTHVSPVLQGLTAVRQGFKEIEGRSTAMRGSSSSAEILKSKAEGVGAGGKEVKDAGAGLTVASPKSESC